MQTRELLPEAQLPGENEELDEMICLFRMHLSLPFIFTNEGPDSIRSHLAEELEQRYAEIRNDYNKNEKSINENISHIADDSNVKETLKNYWLICNYQEHYMERKDSAKYYLDKAQKYDPNASPYTSKDVRKIKKQVKKSLRRIRTVIAERGAFKISITSQTASTVALFFIPALFFSGYIYNYLLLSAFGVNVSVVFSLEDYIVASIAETGSVLFSSCVAIVGLCYGVRRNSVLTKYERKRASKRAGYRFYFIIICGLLAIILYWYMGKDYSEIYLIIYIVALLFSLFIAEHVSFKYFENAIVTFSCFVFLVTMVTKTVYSARVKTDKIIDSESAEIKKYKFKFDDSQLYPETEMVLIVGGSDFYIFYNKKIDSSIVVPKKHVISFSTLAED